MRYKELLKLQTIGLTDGIRDMAFRDQGKEKRENAYWRRSPYTEYDIRYYLRAEVEEGILKLEVYQGEDIRKCNEEPLYRIYLSAEEGKYATYLQREWKWSKAKMRNLPDTERNWDNIYKESYWIAKAEKETVQGYLGELDQSKGIKNIIEDWQTNAMHQKEIKEIDRVMNQIIESPADFGQWVEKEAFWGQQYLFYNHKKLEAYCSACKERSKTNMKSVHNRIVTCPACGRKIMAKSWNRQKSLVDIGRAALIQKIPEGIIIRKFHCRKELILEKDWEEKLIISEDSRRLYTRELNPVRDYEYEYFKTHGPLRWCKSQYINVSERAVVYPGNLCEVRKDTKLADIPLEIMLNREKGERVNIESLLHPGRMVGYLIHAGLTRLAMDKLEGGLKNVNEKAESAGEALGIDGNRIHRLKECDGGRIALEWLQCEQKTGRKIPQETLNNLQERGLRRGDLEDILCCGITPQRVLNYLDKQGRGQREVLTEWKDYLNMATREGMDLNDDIVRFPKDLRRRHNELVERENDRKNKEKLKEYRKINKKIQKHLPEAARYYWEDKDYMIVPAAKCEELVREGQMLHHCVGASTNYMEKMAKGISWILFLRRKEDLEDPWYTIEIDMKTDQIFQWYSSYDRRPDKEKVRKILNKFQRSVKRKREQERVRVMQTMATA